MPLLNFKTNITLDNKKAFAEAASKAVAQIAEKPESYVMISIEDDQNLMFAGSHQACAHVEFKSLGMDESQTTTLSTQICAFIESQTSIDSARIYIEFYSPDRHMWGWDKRTFAK